MGDSASNQFGKEELSLQMLQAPTAGFVRPADRAQAWNGDWGTTGSEAVCDSPYPFIKHTSLDATKVACQSSIQPAYLYTSGDVHRAVEGLHPFDPGHFDVEVAMSDASVIEPLDLVSVRLPRGLIAKLRALAAAQSLNGHRVTLSDALRSHVSLDQVKALGNQRPRRRAAAIAPANSKIDPVTMRQLAAIGGNINQIARAVNHGVNHGAFMQATVLLSALASLEREVAVLTCLLKSRQDAR